MSVVSHIASDTRFCNASAPKAGVPVMSVHHATVFCDARAPTPDRSPITIAPALMRVVFIYPPTITVVSSIASETKLWYANAPRVGVPVISVA